MVSAGTREVKHQAGAGRSKLRPYWMDIKGLPEALKTSGSTSM